MSATTISVLVQTATARIAVQHAPGQPGSALLHTLKITVMLLAFYRPIILSLRCPALDQNVFKLNSNVYMITQTSFSPLQPTHFNEVTLPHSTDNIPERLLTRQGGPYERSCVNNFDEAMRSDRAPQCRPLVRLSHLAKAGVLILI